MFPLARGLWPVLDGGQRALADRTATVLDSVERLSDGIEDLRRRCDAAGRDWEAIDVTFINFDGGSPARDEFNADAYLDGLEKLAKLGVTWVSVGLPGDSVAHALETLERFRTLVIDAI